LVPGAHPEPRPPRPLLPIAVAGAWLIAWSALGEPGVSLAGFAARIPAIGVAALTYARLLVWPVGLHLERFTAVPGWSTASALTAWALAIGILAALVWAAGRVRDGWLPLALAALAYLPVSGVV